MKKVILGLTFLFLAGTVVVAYAQGPGMMGGYGPGWYGMGPGMMGGYGGYGMGPGYGGCGGYGMGPGYGGCGGYGMGPGMMGGYGGYRMGPGYGWRGPGPGYAQSEECQKFLDNTTGLRKELYNKRFEYSEVVRNPKTSSKTIEELEKEIRELQEKIYAKAPQGCWW